MEIKEIKQKLKSFFIEKYRSAGGHRISGVKLIDDSDPETICYSFNLKCKHKREDYSLNFILQLFLSEKKFQQKKDEYNAKKTGVIGHNMSPRIDFMIESSDLFGYPFMIVFDKKDEKK